MATETELKFAVDGEAAFDALIRHLDLPAREFHHSVLQVNHFFDTPSFRLLEQRIALRLREEGGRHVLCIKGPANVESEAVTSRLEVEVRLGPNDALDVLRGSVSPRDALAKRLAERNAPAIAMLDAALGGQELHYVGRFENRRTRVTRVNVEIAGETVPLVLELDRTTFGDRIDHEIEVELDARTDPAAALEAFTRLLADAGVVWRVAPSKAQRFFEHLRG